MCKYHVHPFGDLYDELVSNMCIFPPRFTSRQRGFNGLGRGIALSGVEYRYNPRTHLSNIDWTS